MVVSLPCDKNKGFTDLIHREFRVVEVTREEDGVGICAGAYLVGGRPVMSIQSSGIGNMLNAMMSLTACYGLPLVILASWRGVDDERIEAQKPFNTRIRELLKVYGIDCTDIADPGDIPAIGRAVKDVYAGGRISVVLIRPRMWGRSERIDPDYPPRGRRVSLRLEKEIRQPTMTRLEAISAVMGSVGRDDIVVSNIGVPSKEVFASGDRPLNFYMLGSYTQATPIGLGMALCTDRRVVVVDGDGSLLGSSVFPDLACETPPNLTVVCVDNGTFGSTGNQINPAYDRVDIGAVAMAFGLDVETVYDREGIVEAMSHTGRTRFIQAMIVPRNSDADNIALTAEEIRDRFMDAVRSRCRLSLGSSGPRFQAFMGNRPRERTPKIILFRNNAANGIKSDSPESRIW